MKKPKFIECEKCGLQLKFIVVNGYEHGTFKPCKYETLESHSESDCLSFRIRLLEAQLKKAEKRISLLEYQHEYYD